MTRLPGRTKRVGSWLAANWNVVLTACTSSLATMLLGYFVLPPREATPPPPPTATPTPTPTATPTPTPTAIGKGR